MPKPWFLLNAPMTTTAASAGTRGLGTALRGAGLDRRLGATPSALLDADMSTKALVSHIGKRLDAGERPLVLGGDCGVAIGARALLGRGRHGLAYIDAHSDFSHAGSLETQPATARGELAALTGRAGEDAVFRDEDVAVIGFRRDDPAFHELKQTKLLLWPMFWLYEHSRQELDKSLLRRLDRQDLDGLWIHLDLDALDPSVVSAVTHPLADGLSGPELIGILRLFLGTNKVAGMSVANFYADRDPSNREAAFVVDLLASALEPRPDGEGA